MQIQRQSPGLTELLARLLPGLGSAIGGAAGGTPGGLAGASLGGALGGAINQPQQEAQMIGGKPGMQQIESPQGGGALEGAFHGLLSQLNNMQKQKEDAQQQGAPSEAIEGAEQEQKDTFKKFYDMLSPSGQSQVVTLLKTIALPQMRK